MNKPLVIIEGDHFLRSKIDPKRYTLLDAESEDLMTDDLVDLPARTVVFDLTIGSADEKRQLLECLEDEKALVYSDLSTVWGEGFFENFRCLQGAFALGYQSPKNCYEFYSPKNASVIQEFLESAELKGLSVSTAGMGFHFPRMLAQIINEAYFALEDQLASAEDLDLALVHGVNYPKGPIDWSKGMGLRTTIYLLDELYSVTGDPRYRTSTKLRLEFLKSNR